MATLTIHREKSKWVDRGRNYAVIVDGEERGKVANGGSFAVDLGPGMHGVRMAVDWCGSHEIEIDGDEVTALHCASRPNPLLSALYITLWRNDYIRLWQGDARSV